MMWQDFVFLAGSIVSVVFLYPTLRDRASRVPLATSIPSMLIGCAYSVTFLTLGMTFSAAGAFAACTMWSLIAAFRAPNSPAIFTKLSVPSLPGKLGYASSLPTKLSVPSKRLERARRKRVRASRNSHDRHTSNREQTDDVATPSHSD